MTSEPAGHKAPAVVIQNTEGWASLQLRAVWEYRELLYFLVWRDVKVRYKQTALGVTWIVLQPLVSTLVFTVLFGVLLRRALQRSALPDLRLRRPAALAVLRQLADPLLHQPGGQRQPDHQGLLPAAGDPHERRAVRPGGLCGGPGDAGGADADLPHPADAGRAAAARLPAAGHGHGAGLWPVALGARTCAIATSSS